MLFVPLRMTASQASLVTMMRSPSMGMPVGLSCLSSACWAFSESPLLGGLVLPGHLSIACCSVLLLPSCLDCGHGRRQDLLALFLCFARRVLGGASVLCVPGVSLVVCVTLWFTVLATSGFWDLDRWHQLSGLAIWILFLGVGFCSGRASRGCRGSCCGPLFLSCHLVALH